MNIAYGYEIAPVNDRYVAIAEDAIDRAVNACLPGRRLVNIFPSCAFNLSSFERLHPADFALHLTLLRSHTNFISVSCFSEASS